MAKRKAEVCFQLLDRWALDTAIRCLELGDNAPSLEEEFRFVRLDIRIPQSYQADAFNYFCKRAKWFADQIVRRLGDV